MKEQPPQNKFRGGTNL